MKSKTLLSLGLAALVVLTGCGTGVTPEAKYPTGADRASTGGDIYKKPDSIFGANGLSLFGRKKDESETGIGVNAYLWRAALDTISFMPLESADPFGGVILTDWYTPPETPDERVKLTVLILDKQLSVNGVQVKAFRQEKTKGGSWRDTPVADDVPRKLEDAILTRARQLRVDGKLD